ATNSPNWRSCAGLHEGRHAIMRPAGMGMHGGPIWLRRDDSILQQELPKGILRRMIRFAAPHRKMIVLFLCLIVVDAGVTNINPLIIRSLINNGIGGHDTDLIVRLGLLMATVSLTDALLTLGQTYVSARVGQSVLFDMRTKVFSHVQR